MFATALDGMSFRASDGRVVKLAGILATRPEARAALAAHLAGHLATLAGTAPDRYGRLRAQVFVDGVWLQRALVRAGLALAAPDRVSRACAAALLAAENTARTARAGLWQSTFAVLTVPAVMAAARKTAGHFAIVEGKVVSAAVVHGRAYLNFGADYRTDFTVTIAPDDMRLFRAAHFDPLMLKGRRVRVRGWLALYRGPEISPAVPEAIETLR